MIDLRLRQLLLVFLVASAIFFSMRAFFAWMTERRLRHDAERNLYHWLGYHAQRPEQTLFSGGNRWVGSKRSAAFLSKVFPEIAQMSDDRRAHVGEWTVALLIASFLVGYGLFASYAGAFASQFLAALFGRAWLRRVIAKEQERLKSQLPEVLDYVAAALSAGSGFTQALEHAVRESSPPISLELKSVVDQVGVGVGLDEALLRLNERLGLVELKTIILALSMHRRAGGNLVELLENAKEMLRERIALGQQVLAETAQARLSGTIVGLLPVFVMGIVCLMDPGFVAPLFRTWQGESLLLSAALADGIGFVLIRRILKLSY